MAVSFGMPSVSFDSFFRGVRKGEIPGAVYLYGPEDVLKDEVVAEILDRVLDPSLRDFNLDVRSAQTLDPEQAETLCNTLPMMADRRVVIIRDIETWNRRARAKKAVLGYLDRPVPETVLVLVQGAGEPGADKDLTSRMTAVEAPHLPPDRARRWLDLEAERSGVELADDAADHLIRVAQAELGIVKIELAKLAGIAAGQPLTVELVADLLGVRHGETQYDWRDLVLNGDTVRAIAVLPHVLAQSGVGGVSLVMLLGTSLVGLGLARAHYERGARGGRLVQAVKGSLFRARPARVSYDAAAREWSQLAPAWPRRRIDQAVRSTLRADQRLKSTTVSDERGILIDLLLDQPFAARSLA